MKYISVFLYRYIQLILNNSINDNTCIALIVQVWANTLLSESLVLEQRMTKFENPLKNGRKRGQTPMTIVGFNKIVLCFQLTLTTVLTYLVCQFIAPHLIAVKRFTFSRLFHVPNEFISKHFQKCRTMSVIRQYLLYSTLFMKIS